jgi:hypothetical protein
VPGTPRHESFALQKASFRAARESEWVLTCRVRVREGLALLGTRELRAQSTVNVVRGHVYVRHLRSGPQNMAPPVVITCVTSLHSARADMFGRLAGTWSPTMPSVPGPRNRT